MRMGSQALSSLNSASLVWLFVPGYMQVMKDDLRPAHGGKQTSLLIGRGKPTKEAEHPKGDKGSMPSSWGHQLGKCSKEYPSLLCSCVQHCVLLAKPATGLVSPL